MIHIEFAEFDPFRINREKYLLEFDRSKSSKKNRIHFNCFSLERNSASRTLVRLHLIKPTNEVFLGQNPPSRVIEILVECCLK
jgi:hypothetical protein